MKYDAGITAWPSARSQKSSIAAQFGADRADLAQWALNTGDPLMDAVVDEIHAGHPEVQAMLQTGFREGLAKIANPTPALRALFEQVEQLPPYVDAAFLDNEESPFFSIPMPVHMVSLSAGALIRVYSSPSIAAVLSNTGRLVDGSERRLQETGKWLVTAMMPGGLKLGAPGYIATLQVRLLHAHMRRGVVRKGYDETANGVAINQVDLARTWMDFTVTALAAESAMGFALTSTETAQHYRTWWYVGHLLGVDAGLIEGISDNDQALRIDRLLQAVTGPLVPEAQQLAAATIDSIASQLNDALHVPKAVGSCLLRALARRFHGDAMADELGLRREALASAFVATAASQIRRRRLTMRRDSQRWTENRQANIAAAGKLMTMNDKPLFEASHPK